MPIAHSSPSRLRPRLALPAWAPHAALTATLVVAWVNFLTTARWAAEPGALHGWRKPWYALALVVATVLAVRARRRIGTPAAIGRTPLLLLLVTGAGVLIASLFSRLPLTSWTQIPFKDDWTELFQQSVNAVALLRRGVVLGWNWWFLGGYPASTDIAQNFGTVAFLPMVLFGETVGYHVLHAVLFLAVPAFVWWDIRHEDRNTAILAAAFACFFTAGYLGWLGSSGDTNSLVGVFCAALALSGSRAARLGRRWGGPVMLAGLTLALHTHTAFAVYAGIYLLVEAWYFRDRTALLRLAAACAFAGIAALPAHWESLRYPGYVSFNNTVYDPGTPRDWPAIARNIYYNVEILLLPHRWFNDYRSLANVWLPVLVVAAFARERSRVGYFAVLAVLTQALLRVNSSEAGALFDRIQHMFPLLAAPALAGFVLRAAGTRQLGLALCVLIAAYVQTSFAPIPHVPDLRAWNPPLMDRVAASDGMVLVEVSPHRDMDSDPERRTPTTPFDVHFEGLLPRLAGQRFYSQMIDGWVWNIYRGQVVGAGTFMGRRIDETPHDGFIAELQRWGVRHLFVWTDASREYLSHSPRFVERWRQDRWSHFELLGADTRSVVTPSGTGELRNLDLLGADVALRDVEEGGPVIVRANYYPAWRAFVDGREIDLYAADGQLAFIAPRGGTYVVRLEYPRYRLVTTIGLVAFAAGVFVLARWPRPRRK